MKKEMLILVMAFIILPSFVFAQTNEATCGNNICEAGYRLGEIINDKFEDISTCFEDCQSSDWVKCEVDSVSGGTCDFNGKLIEFTNLVRTGCGATSDINLAYDVDYDGHIVNFIGADPYYYAPILDDLSVSYAIWPCAVDTTKQILYIRGNLNQDKYNEFMTIDTSEIILKQITSSSFDLIFSFDYKGLSSPRINLDIVNSETGISLGSMSGAGSSEQRITLSTDSVDPGKYLVTARLLDVTDNNIISEESSNIIIHECLVSNSCDDGKFWTKDTCSGTEYNVCSSTLNYLVVITILIVLVFLVAVVIYLMKR